MKGRLGRRVATKEMKIDRDLGEASEQTLVAARAGSSSRCAHEHAMVRRITQIVLSRQPVQTFSVLLVAK